VGREVRKEEIDYEQFVDEAQFFLAQIRGDGVDDDEALARTVRSYPAVSEMDVRGWARDPAFQRTLRHAREQGAENRAYDERMAATRSPDPFAAVPRLSAPDLAQVEYVPQAEKHGLGGWLRRLSQALVVQQAQPETPQTAGGTFTAIEDLTPAQVRAAAQQRQSERPAQPWSVFSSTPNPDSCPEIEIP
jgi:hypothetical protein